MSQETNIIKKCIAGDKSAQRTLYDSYKKSWFMIGLRYGKNKMEAEDIFQDGVIEIFNSLRNYDQSRSKFITWSSRIVVFKAIAYLKKNSWQNLMLGLDHVEQVETGETAIEMLSNKELTKLISQLPIGYRVVFNMYAIEGMSHKEIAHELKISEGTSKSQLFKARKMLKTQIESQLNSMYYE